MGPKVPLPLPPMIQKKSAVHKEPIPTNTLNRQNLVTNVSAKQFQPHDHSQVIQKDLYTSNRNKDKENKHISQRSLSPYSEPPVLKVESRSDLQDVSDCSVPPHPPSLP